MQPTRPRLHCGTKWMRISMRSARIFRPVRPPRCPGSLAIDQRIASKGSLRTDAARRMRDLSINGKRFTKQNELDASVDLHQSGRRLFELRYLTSENHS